MDTKDEKVRFVTNLPFTTVRDLKIIAAEEGTSGNKILIRLIQDEKRRRENEAYS